MKDNLHKLGIEIKLVFFFKKKLQNLAFVAIIFIDIDKKIICVSKIWRNHKALRQSKQSKSQKVFTVETSENK